MSTQVIETDDATIVITESDGWPDAAGSTRSVVTTPKNPSAEPPPLDVAALADELLAQRARLDAAEDALDHLIVASLEGSL